MKSYQNLKILQNLYRLKAIGYDYTDTLELNAIEEDEVAKDIPSLHRQIATCHLCDFSKSRTQSMPGFGNANAKIMFIDHTVSQLEDNTNSYFCGRSGEMLQKMIENVLELTLEEVFFTHTIKCKPLHLQPRYETQWQSCKSYLLSQIRFVAPKVIVTLGEESFENLTAQKGEFEKLRGHVMELYDTKLVPTYHPSFLLRNPDMKKIVFNDLKTIKTLL